MAISGIFLIISSKVNSIFVIYLSDVTTFR